MAKKIADFLVEVTENPARRQAYRNNPAGELASSGLDANQRQMIAGDDIKAIRQQIKNESGGNTLVVMYESVTFESVG